MKAYLTGIGRVNATGYGAGQVEGDIISDHGPLPKLKRKDVFKEPYQRFGRLDEFSRVGLAAIAFAMQDAGLEAWTEKRPIGIIAETDHGCLNTDLGYFETVVPDHGKFASPNLFAYTLPNCFLGEAAIRYGLTGPSYIINSHPTRNFECLRIGLQELDWNNCDKVVLGINNPEIPAQYGIHDRLVGALFVVLEKNPINPASVYGLVELTRRNVLFAAAPVTDLCQVVHEAIPL